ncbi:MAG: hypothetical protein JRH15_18230, partial [Deltaproteobacteria bacterium]|nr:hypothetical protein [Deltaproteobacteria bacterium]
MFNQFFYQLKEAGIPVSPTAFLRLHGALKMGLVSSLNEFYIVSRAVLVKSERYFDLFDQVFAHYFQNGNRPPAFELSMDEQTRAIFEQWLLSRKELAEFMDLDESELNNMTPEQLMALFNDRLDTGTGDPGGAGDAGGIGGLALSGQSGAGSGGTQSGGGAGFGSAVQVAMNRRYKDYSLEGPLTQSMVGEALKRLRHLKPVGPEDKVDVGGTIYQTMKNAGEIEIVFHRALKDRLRIIIAIDNGGYSMDSHVKIVQTLFDHARSQFEEIKTFYFHNTIYDFIWEDPTRFKKPQRVMEMDRLDPESRLIIVGDASMAPYELTMGVGPVSVGDRRDQASIRKLTFLAETFSHAVW